MKTIKQILETGIQFGMGRETIIGMFEALCALVPDDIKVEIDNTVSGEGFDARFLFTKNTEFIGYLNLLQADDFEQLYKAVDNKVALKELLHFGNGSPELLRNKLKDKELKRKADMMRNAFPMVPIPDAKPDYSGEIRSWLRWVTCLISITLIVLSVLLLVLSGLLWQKKSASKNSAGLPCVVPVAAAVPVQGNFSVVPAWRVGRGQPDLSAIRQPDFGAWSLSALFPNRKSPCGDDNNQPSGFQL